MIQNDRARLYHRSRPHYSPQVVGFVAQHIGDRLQTVADIGCGTGLSTRPFHEVADTLVGVDPDAEMRAVATEYLSDVGGRVLEGSAEVTGLDDRSVDLLVAASCFGWFDIAATSREFRRVLRNDGSVLLMWHYPAQVDAATYEWERLWRGHMGPRLGPSREDIELLLVPWFLPQPRRYFRHVDHYGYDRRRLQDLAFSSRYAPRYSQQRRREALIDSIDKFYDRHAAQGAVFLAVETVAVLGQMIV